MTYAPHVHFRQRLDTIKMCHSTYFPNVCVSVIFTYCQNGGETDGVGFYYLETDGVEFDTYWQNGGYKKISDIIFAEWHIFIVSNLCFRVLIFVFFEANFCFLVTCSFLYCFQLVVKICARKGYIILAKCFLMN
jgi:hypothetical protein